MTLNTEFRSPTSRERAILERLLSVEFQGRTSLVEQIREIQVRVIDEEGSLEIRVGAAVPADVLKTVPVEADACDSDGLHVHYLLHVRDGFAWELDIYKDGGSPILRQIPVEELEVFALPG